MNYRIADIMKVLKCDEAFADKVLEKMEESDIRFSECSTAKFNKYAKEAKAQLRFEEWYTSNGKTALDVTVSDIDYFYDKVLPTLK